MARPQTWMEPRGDAFAAEPYVHATFPAESISIVVGVHFRADVRDVVPDATAAEFWDEFWAGLADSLEDRLADLLAAQLAGVEAGLQAARESARSQLAARFREVTSRRLPAA